MLAASSRGRIVGGSSFTVQAFRTGMPQFPASAASKGAVEVAVRSLSLALVKDGFTVNCVVPGCLLKDAGTAGARGAETMRQIETRMRLSRLNRRRAAMNGPLGQGRHVLADFLNHHLGGQIFIPAVVPCRPELRQRIFRPHTTDAAN